MNNYITITREQSTKMEPGTLINNENGTNGGIVIQIVPYGNTATIYGTWNEAKPGEKWLWSHVKEVIDNGGHRALNGKINYGPQSKRWQGNTSTGAVKEMHLTEKDFTGSNPRVQMNCWIIGIDVFVAQQGNGIEIANIGIWNGVFKKDDYWSIYRMPYSMTTPFPLWSKFIDLIGSGGRFDIVVKWRSY